MGVKNVDIFHAEPFVHIVSDAVRDCARSLSDEFSSPTAEKQSRADHHPWIRAYRCGLRLLFAKSHVLGWEDDGQAMRPVDRYTMAGIAPAIFALNRSLMRTRGSSALQWCC